MKVLFFCNLVPAKTGAFEALLGALSETFAAAGDSLGVVLGGEPAPAVASAFRERGVTWRALPGWTDAQGVEQPWAFARRAPALVRAERPDVVAVHFGNELPALAACGLAALRGDKAAWVWQQDQQIRDPGALGRHVSRVRALRLGFRHFVAVYDGGKRSLVLRGIPEGRVTVIRNSVPESARTRPAGWLRAELGLPPDCVLAAGVGSLIARKRVARQLEALARIRARAPGLALVLAGDGPERPRLEALARDSGLAGCVRFLGRRDDVREILPECDVLVHTAAAEGSAYVIPEAMSSAVPAVVLRAGAAVEQVRDGETGYVLDADDLAGFAARLAELACDAALRRRLGAAARARWQAEYRVEVAARRYHELYRLLCCV